nr:unnamed protein product [Meloidogyne enterolobii]
MPQNQQQFQHHNSWQPHPLMNVLPNNQSYLNNINIYPTNVVPDTPSYINHINNSTVYFR